MLEDSSFLENMTESKDSIASTSNSRIDRRDGDARFSDMCFSFDLDFLWCALVLPLHFDKSFDFECRICCLWMRLVTMAL